MSEKYWVIETPEEVYLSHHGILGMKWGKKNGPPYPLDAEDHSKREKSAGYKKSIAKGRENKRKGLTEKQKEALKTTAALVGTAALATAGAYLATDPRVRSLIAKKIFKPTDSIDDLISKSGPQIVNKVTGEVLTDDILNVNLKDLDRLSNMVDKADSVFKGIKAHDSNLKLRADLMKHFDAVPTNMSDVDVFFACNPLFKGQHGVDPYSNNCMGCAIQQALSKMGIMSTASANGIPGGLGFEKGPGVLTTIDEAFQGVTTEKKLFQNVSTIRSHLLSEFEEGASGILGRKSIDQLSGQEINHAIAWEIHNGKVKFSDGQQANAALKAIRSMHPDLSESEAKKMVFDKLSDLTDDYLESATNLSSPVFLTRLDTATGINIEELTDFIHRIPKSK